ncbi:MAG: xanthine dehydrogenase family protein subunit M [Acidobacteria bacterium]|nr:xanthine dehydrogenase family protein subunit M [Acidobacteriota bacterium]
MKPAPFEYHAPERLDEAAQLLAEHADEAKILAGGQSLIPMLALRLTSFPHLVDLGRVADLRGVEQANGSVRIKAMTTQAAIEKDASVGAAVPLLAKAIPLIGHFQIRNRGTVGGSIAHADPASELPAVALALDASIEVTGKGGTRTVAAADFFEGTWTTAMAEDEILSAVSFPTWSGTTGFGVEELARRHGDFAIAGVVAGVELDGSSVKRAAIALFGMDSTPVRASSAEAAVTGTSGAAADLEAAGQAAVAELDPPTDIHGSSAYRKKVGAVLVARALTQALEEARRG